MSLSKEQLERLGNSEEFQDALEDAGKRAPADLECFRDGCIIADYPCRLTIGRLAVVSITNARFFSADLPEGYIPTPHDMLTALYVLTDKHFEDVIRFADRPDKLDKKVARFAAGFSPRETQRVIGDLVGWFKRISEIMGEGDKDGPTNDPDWWADAVDIIASEYGWEDHYILWILPLVRAEKYQASIVARKTGHRRIPRIREEVTDAVDIMEKVLHGSG